MHDGFLLFKPIESDFLAMLCTCRVTVGIHPHNVIFMFKHTETQTLKPDGNGP